MLQSNLKWDKHIDNIISNGNKALGFLKRNLKTANQMSGIPSTVPGRFTLNPVRPLSRFAPIPVCPHLLIVLKKMKYGKYHCNYSYFGCCKACSWVLYFCLPHY